MKIQPTGVPGAVSGSSPAGTAPSVQAPPAGRVVSSAVAQDVLEAPQPKGTAKAFVDWIRSKFGFEALQSKGTAGGATQNPLDALAKKVRVDGQARAAFQKTNEAEKLVSRISKYQSTEQWSGGFNSIQVHPLPEGFRLELDMRTQGFSDKVSIGLWAEVFDEEKKVFAPLCLTFLQVEKTVSDGAPPKFGATGKRVFDVRTEDLNAYLKRAAPNSKLEVTPGVTPLFVTAQWPSMGHRAGGPGEGSFTVPAPKGPDVYSTAALAKVQGAKIDAEDIPLDKAFKVPKLVSNCWSLNKSIEFTGEFSSRIEFEAKGMVQRQADWASAIRKLHELAAGNDSKAAEAVFGKGWALAAGFQNPATERFYVKDLPENAAKGVAGTGALKGLRVDAQTGLPLVDGYSDVYSDDPGLSLTRLGYSVRIRGDKNKRELQIKIPGAREFLTAARTEYAIPLKQTATEEDVKKMVEVLMEKPPNGRFYNTAAATAFRELEKAGIDLAKVFSSMKPIFSVVQDRYKFKLQHSSGVELELSLDKVTAGTVRPEHNDAAGLSRLETFYCFEAEVNHKQIASTNSQINPDAFASTASVSFGERAQLSMLQGLSSKATLNVEPSLHSLEELNHPELFQTPTNQVALQAIASLSAALFPTGSVTPGDPKPKEAMKRFNIL